MKKNKPHLIMFLAYSIVLITIIMFASCNAPTSIPIVKKHDVRHNQDSIEELVSLTPKDCTEGQFYYYEDLFND